jgi:hypothetical protein
MNTRGDVTNPARHAKGWPGAVYLLPHVNRLRFKVGWSTQPLRRVKKLPEFGRQQLDLEAADVAWFERAARAREVERALHRSLAPYSAQPGHLGTGCTEWFSIQGMVLARRATFLPLLSAPQGPQASFSTPVHEGALDCWHRVEDLWRRLGMLRPLALHKDREDRILQWFGLRQLTSPGHVVLRAHALNIETYGWHEQRNRRTLVTLMHWDSDDLMHHLIPSRTLQRWEEGDVVDQLLRGYLAGHALSPKLARAIWNDRHIECHAEGPP